MAIPFRVIDTGVRGGREQIAFDEALIELHKAGRVPDTIRFLGFTPSALVGRHQATARELKLEHCRANGVEIVRRITGGGAIYLDPGQVGWEIVLSRRRLPMPTLADYTRSICEAVAYGLSKEFAIDARYRSRNDIEVAGRKLSGTGGFFDGDTLIYQGTVLVDVDAAAMMACLNVPADKLAKRDLDKAETRVTTLKELLGHSPGIARVKQAVVTGLAEKLRIAPNPGEATAAEWTDAKRAFSEEIGTDEFVFAIDDPGGAEVREASRTGPGGTLTAFVRLDGPAAGPRIREVLLTGDFFVTPPRMVYDLEAALRGVAVTEAGAAVDAFFSGNKPDLLSIASADFRAVIEAAVGSQP